jgi:hypothetical protein
LWQLDERHQFVSHRLWYDISGIMDRLLDLPRRGTRRRFA